MRKESFERSKGFTLVELMVVIAIIGILAVVALGIVRGAQQRAVNAALKAQAANLTTALESYYSIETEYPDPITKMWDKADTDVLDKAPQLSSGCEAETDSGLYDGAVPAGECGIGVVSVDKNSYELEVRYTDDTTDTFSGGAI